LDPALEEEEGGLLSSVGDSGGVSGTFCGAEGCCEGCWKLNCPFGDIGEKGREEA